MISSKILALAFQGVLSTVAPGTANQSLYYRPVGSTGAHFEVPVTAASPPPGSISSAYYQKLKGYADATALRVLSYASVVMAPTGNIRTVTIDSSTPGIAVQGDSTAAVQAILDQATAPGVDWLIVNLDVTVTAFAVAHNNTYIKCGPGGGMRAPDGNPADPDNGGVRHCLQNANPSLIRGIFGNQNLIVEGGTWDGNATAQRANSPLIGWMGVFRFRGQKGLVLKNCKLIRGGTFATHFLNTEKVYITGCTIIGGAGNTDPIHFNGIQQDVLVENCALTGQDDHIGVNAADRCDYDMAPGEGKANSTFFADLADVTNSGMQDMVFRYIRLGDDEAANGGGRTAMRVNAGGAAYCRRIWFEHTTGLTHEYWLTMVNFGEKQPGSAVPFGNTAAQDIGFSNIHITLAERGAAGACANISADTDGILFHNIFRDDLQQFSKQSITFTGSDLARIPHHTNIVIDGYSGHDTSAVTAGATPYNDSHIYIAGDVVVTGKIEICNCTVVREGDMMNKPFININGQQQCQLELRNIRTKGLKYIAQLDLPTSLAQITANDLWQVDGTASIFLTDGASNVPSIVAKNYRGPQVLQSLSNQPTAVTS